MPLWSTTFRVVRTEKYLRKALGLLITTYFNVNNIFGSKMYVRFLPSFQHQPAAIYKLIFKEPMSDLNIMSKLRFRGFAFGDT